jgi:hypothetical protein
MVDFDFDPEAIVRYDNQDMSLRQAKLRRLSVDAGSSCSPIG